MSILVDRRSGSKELETYLPTGLCQITDLESGDASFLGWGAGGPYTLPVGIERKAFYDLFTCFIDGRLNTQIQTMTGYYKKIYIIVEGRPRVSKDNQMILAPRNGKWVETRISYGAIDNYLNTLTDELHIQVKRSFDLQETCWQIVDIYNHCNTEKHGSHLKLDTTWEITPFMPPSFKKRVAAQLDGIGNKKADDIAGSFASVQDMANAPEDQWKKISGVGKVIARSIVKQFQNS